MVPNFKTTRIDVSLYPVCAKNLRLLLDGVRVASCSNGSLSKLRNRIEFISNGDDLLQSGYVEWKGSFYPEEGRL